MCHKSLDEVLKELTDSEANRLWLLSLGQEADLVLLCVTPKYICEVRHS